MGQIDSWGEAANFGGEDQLRGLSLIREVRAALSEGSASLNDELVVGTWKSPNGVSVVALAGEMDMSNAGEAETALEACLAAGFSRLIVDLSQLRFIDSSGINTLLKVSRNVDSRQGVLALAAPTEHVARVFLMVRLVERVAISDSLEAALAQTLAPLVPVPDIPGSGLGGDSELRISTNGNAAT